ncbi:MAG: hypothetical protein LBH10_03900 [Burkholderiaceae bacterium]|nr:hypothetical protein [Burkholderiaceae bacterium]
MRITFANTFDFVRAARFAPRVAGCGIALALVLSGCALPVNVAPGMPASQVIAALGQPTARYTLPNGGQRLQYSQAPMGRRVYNVDLDAQGRAVGVEQALDETLFSRRIAINHWTRDDVLREYGPPMRAMTVHNFDGQIWVWRYYDPLAEPYRLYIDVDRGNIVRGYSTVDESLLLGGRGRR